MNEFEQAVRTIRFLAVDAVEQAKSGHPGAPMALAGITTDLFTRHLRYDPADPNWPNRDRFVLSAGHASMLVYAVQLLASLHREATTCAPFVSGAPALRATPSTV